MAIGTFNLPSNPQPPPEADAEAKLVVGDNAAGWILTLLQAEGKSPATWALRIGVRGGGCSGFMYDIRWDEPQETDRVFVHANGARVCIDPKSLALVAGSVVEYHARLQGAGFALANPNVTSQCGCGVSFSV